MKPIQYVDYSSGERKVLATISLEDGKVTFSKDTLPVLVQEWNKDGVMGAGFRTFYPKDGEKFISALYSKYGHGLYHSIEDYKEAKKESASQKSGPTKTKEEMQKEIVW